MAQERNDTTGDAGTRQVRDVMTASPECVSGTGSVRDVAQIMKQHDTGVVPVVDGKKVIGMITDRDIVVRGIAEGKDLASTSASELMSSSVRTVRDDSTLSEALTLMSGAEIRRVPVVNGKDEIVGILSLGDVAKQGNQDQQVGGAVEKISEAPPNN